MQKLRVVLVFSARRVSLAAVEPSSGQLVRGIARGRFPAHQPQSARPGRRQDRNAPAGESPVVVGGDDDGDGGVATAAVAVVKGRAQLMVTTFLCSPIPTHVTPPRVLSEIDEKK